MQNKRVLIICYTFPPDNSIGGKRWSKFAKYLSNNNYEVHVITKKVKISNYNPKDYGLENVIVHQIDGFYPKVLTKKPNTFLSWIYYNLWKYILLLLVKGTIYDKSIYMKRRLQKKMTSLICDLKIDSVFVTCAPFYLSVFAAQLKGKLSFFLTVDFRDPWTWGKSYGYSTFSEKRQKFDQNAERFVIDAADLITSPSVDILNHLSAFYNDKTLKLLHVPHGVDVHNVVTIKNHKLNKPTSTKLKCVYAGTLYDSYDEFLNKLFKALETLKSKSFDLYVNFEFEIFSTNDFKSYVSQVNHAGFSDKIKFFQAIPEKDLFAKLPNYDLSIVYFPEKYKDFISTKFYELIYIELPILFIGKPGIVSSFIEDNELGSFINLENLDNQFSEKLDQLITREYNPKFDKKEYTFERITNEMMQSVRQRQRLLSDKINLQNKSDFNKQFNR